MSLSDNCSTLKPEWGWDKEIEWILQNVRQIILKTNGGVVIILNCHSCFQEANSES